jgi:fumarate reductase subunit D
LSQPIGAFASTVQLSALIACLGFLTHSLVDFNLHIPANALLFFLMANLATTEIRQPTSQVPNSGIARQRHRIH